MEERIVLNQGNYQYGHKSKYITKDFYNLIGETFQDRGYKYLKTYGTLTKPIGKFTVQIGFQTSHYNDVGFIYDDGKTVKGNITVWIHKSISFTSKDGEIHWIKVDHYKGKNNLIYGCNIWHISKRKLKKVLAEISKTLEHMEKLAAILDHGEKIDMYELPLDDRFSTYKYVDNGLKEKIENKYTKRPYPSVVVIKNSKGMQKALDRHKWYEFYTEDSVKNVYDAFYRFLNEQVL